MIVVLVQIERTGLPSCLLNAAHLAVLLAWSEPLSCCCWCVGLLETGFYVPSAAGLLDSVTVTAHIFRNPGVPSNSSAAFAKALPRACHYFRSGVFCV